MLVEIVMICGLGIGSTMIPPGWTTVSATIQPGNQSYGFATTSTLTNCSHMRTNLVLLKGVNIGEQFKMPFDDCELRISNEQKAKFDFMQNMEDKTITVREKK